jgi:hypothetical protein
VHEVQHISKPSTSRLPEAVAKIVTIRFNAGQDVSLTYFCSPENTTDVVAIEFGQQPTKMYINGPAESDGQGVGVNVTTVTPNTDPGMVSGNVPFWTLVTRDEEDPANPGYEVLTLTEML